MLRLKNDKTMQQELWMGWLPQEMLKLSEELSFVDKILVLKKIPYYGFTGGTGP